MLNIRPLLAAGLVLAGVGLAPALAQEQEQEQEERGLLDVLEEDGRFSTLLDALQAADTTYFYEQEEEDEDSEYTLFAPTDDAFAALPEGVLDTLLQPDNRDVLTAILEHHVLADGAVAAADLTDGQSLDPASGENYEAAVDGEAVTVKQAAVVAPDLRYDLGIAHGIDTVLVPAIVLDALKYRGVYPEEG